jgi:hypothetical protein
MTKPRKADPKKEARDRRLQRAKGRSEEEGPPHSIEAERAALGCVILAGEMGSQAEADEMIRQLRPAHFYDLKHFAVFDAMRQLRMENHAVDTVTLHGWLKDNGKLKELGGAAFLSELPEGAANVFAFPNYLKTLKDKALRRWGLQKTSEMHGYFASDNVTLEDAKGRLGELFDATDKASGTRSKLRMWTPSELKAWKPNPKTFLVGDNEIRTGYDGLTVIGGPGSSGKSQMVAALALAACRGSGLWQGRKVHRQFKVFIIQAENGAFRLKREIEAMQKAHPDLKFDEHIRISDPPEGGIDFSSPEFRSELRRELEKFKPDLVVIDPWSAVACEDSAKEVVEMLVKIRTSFPGGDDCPGLLVVAHTNKPRADVVRKGRSMMFMVSGSVALVNTARCVYVLLPWSDDIEDDRIYWACPKLNDGANYAASVWRRRFGDFPVHDEETDPTSWGDDGEEQERRTVTREMIEAVFKKTKRPGMKRSELVRQLVEMFPDEVKSSTAWRVTKEGNYAGEWLDEVAGVVALKKGGKE